MEVNLKDKSITMYKVTHLEDDLPSPFDTTEGWAIMIMLGIIAIVIYIFAFLVYVKYEDYKKNQVLLESHSGHKKKPRIL